MGSAQRDTSCILRATNIHRGFDTPKGRITVLEGVDLTLQRGEMVAVLGSSGVGKTTLLHILGGLDRPDRGEIHFGDRSYAKMSETELASFRNRHVGFVFQFHYLMAEFSALENVMIPLLIARRPAADAQERAELLLSEVGLKERMGHRPAELSGGEQQRVAVARALAVEPDLVIADEPSGNLDFETGRELHRLLVELNRTKNITFLIATHNQPLADLTHRVVRLREGKNEVGR
ncbi:MAG: ABC transporter ATP-binding protein [candidate division Zixibacteria bacterium]|nr:ABC transporter ATP-binding protein [candidate division Zixibacteria bacterium]